MPRRQGFPFAQIDTTFPADPKFRRLAGILTRSTNAIPDDSETYPLAGIGLWLLCVAHAWSNDDPDVGEVVEGTEEFLVEALVRSKLLRRDEDGRILLPEESFERWTSSARTSREGARERKARSRSVTRDIPGVTRSHKKFADREVEVEVETTYLPVEESSPESSPPAGAREEDRDSRDRFYELTLLRPWGKRSGSWLAEMEDEHGVDRTVAALDEEFAAKPDSKDLLSRVAARLDREKARASERKARPKPPPEPEAPEATPEAIEAGKRAYEELRARFGKPSSRNGASAPVGELLGSFSDGSARKPSPALTVDEGSDTESTADGVGGSPSLPYAAPGAVDTSRPN